MDKTQFNQNDPKNKEIRAEAHVKCEKHSTISRTE